MQRKPASIHIGYKLYCIYSSFQSTRSSPTFKENKKKATNFFRRSPTQVMAINEWTRMELENPVMFVQKSIIQLV